ESTADTVSAMQAGVQITSIVHPTSGGPTGQDTATVTTSVAHGFKDNDQVQIFGTGAAFNTLAACTGYDSGTALNQLQAWTVNSVTSTTFTIFNGNISTCPASFSTPTKPNMVVGFGVTKIEPAKINMTNQVLLRYL